MIPDPNALADRLCTMQRLIRQTLIDGREQPAPQAVNRISSADVIYQIDAAVEPILEAFFEDWSRSLPMVVIAEGLEPESGRIFPRGASESSAIVRVIVDPIDGTRPLMYDKRSAWSLAGIAPNRGPDTHLRDIEIAAMTELPTRKSFCSDVLWAIRGRGFNARRENLISGESSPLPLRPSTADTLRHGFASVVNFFPATKVLASELMEFLVERLLGKADSTKALVFDDQYLSTGGQFYELIAGHDRFIADLRGLFYRIQQQPPGLCVHPYDACTALIAEEAGVQITDGLGDRLDGPLDVTTPLHWAGYANTELRAAIEPLIGEFLRSRHCPGIEPASVAGATAAAF